MSYLGSRITREEFIKTRGAETTQSNARVALNMFDHFCQGTYDKTGDQVVLDLELICKQDGNYDRVFKLVNSFIMWLAQDHPELRINMCNKIMSISKHHPSTIIRYVSSIRQFLEEFGQIEFSERRYKRLVKLPKIIDQELEPFRAKQIREFVDTASRKRKSTIKKEFNLDYPELGGDYWFKFGISNTFRIFNDNICRFNDRYCNYHVKKER